MFSRCCLAWCVLMAVMGITSISQADLILWDDEEATIDSSQNYVYLYDNSTASVVTGGMIRTALHAYNSSTVSVTDGEVRGLQLYDNSSAIVSGGTAYCRSIGASSLTVTGGNMPSCWVEEESTFTILRGTVGCVNTLDSGVIIMHGGELSTISINYNNTFNMYGGTITNNLTVIGNANLYAADFRLGSGLTLEDDRLSGTGILSGEWLNGERWQIDISDGCRSTAYIRLINVISGDANFDGTVDGSDVTILAGSWQYGVSDGQIATLPMGDFNGDGAVDGSDVTILAGNWQSGVTAAMASVPEPSVIVLLGGGILTLVLRIRKRRRGYGTRS